MTTLGRETFVEVNDAFLTLTGYSRDEVVGKTSRELSMWSSPEDQKKLGEAQRDERGFRNLELELRTKEGEVKAILISAEVIRLDGDDGYLKMFYDITERKETEEQMHTAIQEVMTDTGWFSHKLMERLANVRSGGTPKREVVDLSQRERQVLERMAVGMSNDAIAAELGIAVHTVRNYISNVYDKLGVHTRGEAIIWARERGIVGS
jgi:PAS domain S-box-containing protein